MYPSDVDESERKERGTHKCSEKGDNTTKKRYSFG